MTCWTDYAVRHAVKHVAPLKSGGSAISPDDYWYAAADLAYFFTGFITCIGIVATIAVILYGARQVNIATANMRSTARQQQMRLLFHPTSLRSRTRRLWL